MAEKGTPHIPAVPGIMRGAREKIAGKRVIFKSPDAAWEHDAGVLVPDADPTRVEAHEDEEAEKGPYAELHKEWEKKNELLRVTEAFGRFSTEGGQELITVFGVEKVAEALDKVLKLPIDERTGLYMLVRTLEPNLAKRKKVYEKMLNAVDEEVKVYGAGFREQKTSADRKQYREDQGGDYAPTAEMATARKMRVREYQMYDRAAFNIVGGLVNAMERAVTGIQEQKKKWALQQLKDTFPQGRAAFVKGVTAHEGSLTKWISLRFERVQREEHRLEADRIARIDALTWEHEDLLAEIRRPYNVELEKLFSDYGQMVKEDLQLETRGGQVILDTLRKAVDDLADSIEEECAAEVRTKLGGYSAEIDKLRRFDVFEDK